MNEWKPFTPTWTYKRSWWQRIMFWRKPTKVTAAYKQVGKNVIIKFQVTPSNDKEQS